MILHILFVVRQKKLKEKNLLEKGKKDEYKPKE
jgi:hypothetical protein